MIRADDERQFTDAFTSLQSLLARPQIKAERNPAHETLLVEGYIPGREFALEGILDRGVFRPLALFDKPDPLDGPFFEETIYVTPPRLSESDQESIVHTIAAAARALGLTHGPIHAECRVNERGVYVLEVAARPIGGLCAKVSEVRQGSRRPSEPEVASSVWRNCSSATRSASRSTGTPGRPSAAAVMMIPIPRRGVLKGVDGLDEAAAIGGVEEVTITAKTDQLLQPLPEGASYLGFIFARRASSDEAVAAVREAHAHLSFDIEKPIAVVLAWADPPA